jgi:hypothetical protein
MDKMKILYAALIILSSVLFVWTMVNIVRYIMADKQASVKGFFNWCFSDYQWNWFHFYVGCMVVFYSVLLLAKATLIIASLL